MARESIYKTLALKGDKTGPVIGIVPITEHLSEKKLAKISGNKKGSNDSTKGSPKNNWLCSRSQQPSGNSPKTQFPYLHRSVCPRCWFPYCLSGEIGRSIRINSQELADFVNAEFADIKE